EPDRPVRLADQVVGRVQRLALIAIGHHGDGAVVLGPRDAAGIVLTRHQPALAVARVAIGVVRRLAEDAHRAGLLLPLHDPVVRDIAPEQEATVADPHRALGPSEARRETLDRRQRQAVRREARVEHLDGWIGIAHGTVGPAVCHASGSSMAGMLHTYRTGFTRESP